MRDDGDPLALVALAQRDQRLAQPSPDGGALRFVLDQHIAVAEHAGQPQQQRRYGTADTR